MYNTTLVLQKRTCNLFNQVNEQNTHPLTGWLGVPEAQGGLLQKGSELTHSLPLSDPTPDSHQGGLCITCSVCPRPSLPPLKFTISTSL